MDFCYFLEDIFALVQHASSVHLFHPINVYFLILLLFLVFQFYCISTTVTHKYNCPLGLNKIFLFGLTMQNKN